MGEGRITDPDEEVTEKIIHKKIEKRKYKRRIIMLKKIILIENDKEYQCNTMKEVVEMLIDKNYYNLSKEEQVNKMKMYAIANCLANKMKVVDENDLIDGENIEGKFIIKDEMTYILSLLTTNNVMLLERIDSNVFTSDLDKSKFDNNYIIVNKFAKELLKSYLRK